MKTSFVLFYLLICCFYSVSSQNYYWSIDKKIPVDIVTDVVSLRLEGEVSSRVAAEILDVEESRIRFLEKVHEKIWRIDLDRESSQHLGRGIPALSVDGSGPIFMNGEICVMPNEKTNINSLISEYNLTLIKRLDYGPYLLAVPNATSTLSIANIIHETEDVAWASPDLLATAVTMNDPLYPDQYYFKNVGQFGGTSGIDIRAEDAWEVTKGCNIRVAVLDEGLEAHEDFAGRVVTGFTPGAVNNNGAPFFSADAHGVACAGIIGATHDNNLGIKGVAPNVTFVPVNVIRSSTGGGFTGSEIATAINWAFSPTGGNADILSNSWGYSSSGYSDANIVTAFTNALTNGRGGKGSIVVFSSGNYHASFSGVAFPANIANVITVGAISRSGAIWGYSSRGAQMDLVAPSGDTGGNGDVRTTDRMGVLGNTTGNYYNSFGGTSAAAPQVAGVAALMLSLNPNLTEPQVRTILQQTATDMGAFGFDNTYGYGRVNAYAAVERVLGGPIAGPIEFCNNATYSLPNSPPYTATWSRVGTPVFSINSSTGYATRTSDGQAFVQATMSTACGNASIRREISVGVPHYNYIIAEAEWIGSGYGQVMSPWGVTEMEAEYTGLSSISQFGWEIWNHFDWSVSPRTSSSSSVDLDYWHWPTPSNQRILIRAQNACGWGQYQETIWSFSTLFSAYTISPNPASDQVVLLFEDLIDPKGLPEEVSLLDQNSAIPVRALKVSESQFRNIKDDGNRLSIDVSSLPRGIYYLHVSYPNRKERDIHRVLLK